MLNEINISVDMIGEPGSIQREIWATLNLEKILKSSKMATNILARSFYKKNSLNFDEIEQECYLNCYKNLNIFDSVKYELAAIIYTSINQAISRHNRRYYREEELTWLHPLDISPLEYLLKVEKLKILQDKINSFSLKEKELIYSRFQQGKTLVEIAQENREKKSKIPSKQSIDFKIKKILRDLRYKLESYDRN